MLIGITGTIGSGKSYIGKLIESIGYKVYDSDDFVKEAYQNNQILQLLEEEFECFNNGVFDKTKLKEILIKDKKNIDKLNYIIHPYVIRRIKETSNTDELVFVQIPLLFECNLEFICDATVCVNVDNKLKETRLLNRDKENYEFIKYLESLQFTQEKKSLLADFIVVNDCDDETLIKRLKSIIDKIKKIL